MSEWKACTLGDVVRLNYGKGLPERERKSGTVPVFSSAGLTGWHDTPLVNSNGIIIGRKGTIGTVYYTDRPFFCIDTAYYVEPEKSIYDIKYLFYLLSTIGLTELNEDSAVPGLNRDTAYAQDILLPPLPEQAAIAGVLSSLDDKIDLLHRQNKTLEGMAEAIWRKMFVEEADAQWDEVSLLDIIDLVGGGTPKTDVVEYWGGSIHWLAAKDITGNHKSFIVQTEKTITEAGLDNSSAKMLPKYSTIISARGTVGNYCILSAPMAFSQSNYGILPKIKECYFFTYLLIAHVIDELRMAAYGSVFDTITTNTFKEQKVRVPSKDQIALFEEGIKPYFNKIYTNTIQICTLSHLRDTLLPKLMSGEVRVKL